MFTNISQLEEYIRQHFLVADAGIVRLICATVIANKLPGDPVWLLIVAPPSGLKTELISALDGTEDIYHLSSLTPQTLISGQKRYDTETSLLHKINHKILTFKDFTTILELNHNAREEILSQLREVYDGKYSKSFGTGLEEKWEGKIGFMAGVTDAIELHQGRISILGERFIQYRMKQPDREAAAEKGIENASRILEIREEMKTLFSNLIRDVVIPEKMPELPDGLGREMIELSNFATIARAGVMRDPKDREITYVFPAEMPVRFTKQLLQLARAFLVMGRLEYVEQDILRQIAISSVPRNRRKVLLTLLKFRKSVDLTGKQTIDKNADEFEDMDVGNESWITKDLALALDLPTTTTRRILEELNALGLVKRIGRVKGNNDAWELMPKYSTLLGKHYKNYDVE